MPALYRLCRVTCLMLIVAAFTACGGTSDTASILLFNGAGVSVNDVAAIATILDNNHLNYATVSSSELNTLSPSQLNAYRLLIVPGGDFMVMGNSLTKATAANIHEAVQHGLN